MTNAGITCNHLNHLLLYGLLSVAFPLQGQDLLHQDTIRIKEVVINSRQIDSEFPGFRKTSIDPGLHAKLNSFSLAELLSVNSHSYIKSYGPGGLATASLRGTGASHTGVSWNGINIGNPMPGQTDFSLITAGLIDEVRISMGGASLDIGHGGIGGIINLETKPVWDRQTSVTINPSAGSFGNISVLTGLVAGNHSFTSVTKTHYSYGANNYPYLNTVIAPEPVRETRTNSRFLRKDLMQEFYLKRKRDVYSARFWYNSADRNLPGSILIQSGAAGEKQIDESLRGMLSFDSERDIGTGSITGAWVFNRLDYYNPRASIESMNTSNSFIIKGEFETKVIQGTSLKMMLNEELNVINSNNYKTSATGSILSLTLIAGRKAGSRLGTTLLVRETMDNKKLLIPDFSAGIEFRLFPTEEHFIRSGFSRTSKIPSMNDRYWYPGGNRNLKNEYAYMFDLGYRTNQKPAQSLRITSEAGLFRNMIRDMIQWRPGEFSYWTADNLNRVNTSGFESSVSLVYSQNTTGVKINAGYTYTRAVPAGSRTETQTANQLMYVPVNQANGSVMAEYRMFYCVWMANYTGRRYITVDNSGYLPGYALNSIILGARIHLRDNQFDAAFRIGNVFNSSYESIAYHPQPGRSYNLSLLYKFNKIRK